MADDDDKSQQTEEPTQKRLDQAREQGDVVKSTEVTAFVLLGGGTLAIAMFARMFQPFLCRLFRLLGFVLVFSHGTFSYRLSLRYLRRHLKKSAMELV